MRNSESLPKDSYAFKNVITPGDIIKTNQDTTPFRKLTDEEYRNSCVGTSKPPSSKLFLFSLIAETGPAINRSFWTCASPKAVASAHDPKPLMMDGPPVYFSHNDVVWSTSREHTRIGMRALRASVRALFKEYSKELKTTAFGKPQLGTFLFATWLLRQWRKETHGIDSAPDTVYFVGYGQSDKCENDWYSILVMTGRIRRWNYSRDFRLTRLSKATSLGYIT
ncbi:hypothetical protein PAAG_04429 [Paracoccidioides lutzii Pb01]|uniref:Uncharacterized protein n=1 Tax=Paracoccidioides lutzii (strain ATCC MYA-826 / Pb01) TaxID=502779 RepID=C1H0Y5_PARBA|nr:hypothetical protein PAAG_04429 [Paracoccidioides lutzii Pb01]EEH33379.2 hypothetical protein PAAG_04429 [Paracoccidioides lutzii Pb01]